jgi:hypothetical protein
MISTIKRKDVGDLDGLFGYGANDVEKERDLAIGPKTELQKALSEFSYHLENPNINVYQTGYGTELVISSDDLSTFTKWSRSYKGHGRFSYTFGYFASELIQNSYDNGYNNFKFDFDYHVFPFFGYKIKGEKDNPLKIFVKGNLAHSGFGRTNFVDTIIDGDVGSNFGCYSINLRACVLGGVSYGVGWISNDLKIYLSGEKDFGFGIDSENFEELTKQKAEKIFGKDVFNGRGGI